MIQVWNRQRRIRIDSGAVKLFCGALAESLNLSDYAFSVIFVGTAAMRRLNKEWRGQDHATDVLSFAYDDELVDGLPFHGEIVIAPEIAARQAENNPKRPGASRLSAAGLRPAKSTVNGTEGLVIGATEREIRKLIVHGALHLMGYDHETDDDEMIRIQNRVLRRRFFSATACLILREQGR